MPIVIVLSSPSGFPIAITGSPTFRYEELAITSGLNSFEGASTVNIARSE